MLYIVWGPQGAGKTTLAAALARRERVSRFSIDEWMSALYGPDAPQPLDLHWVMERVTRCRRRIWDTALEIENNGGGAVLDLALTTAADRAQLRTLVETHGVRSTAYFVTAPAAVRRARVLARNTARGDTFAFEVTGPMFDHMERAFEPPAPEELDNVLVVETGASAGGPP